MNNHVAHYSLAFAKYPLTNAPDSRRMKSLTKTSSGHPHPKAFAVFLCLSKAQARHFYDELRTPNTRPFEGISVAVYLRLVITRHPKLNGVTLSKLKQVGGRYA